MCGSACMNFTIDTGRNLTTAIVRAPEVVCNATNYAYGIDVWAAGVVIWTIFMGGSTMFPELHSRNLRQRRGQVKFHFKAIWKILGTSIRKTDTMVVRRSEAPVFDCLKTYPAKQRIVHNVFYKRLKTAAKEGLVQRPSDGIMREMCSLVTKMMWWLPSSRLIVSTKSQWRERVRFLQCPNGEAIHPRVSKKPVPLFAEFYYFCDISMATLAPKHKLTGKKRERGGERVKRILKNTRIKHDYMKH